MGGINNVSHPEPAAATPSAVCDADKPSASERKGRDISAGNSNAGANSMGR
jgi:hypothetical protein